MKNNKQKNILCTLMLLIISISSFSQAMIVSDPVAIKIHAAQLKINIVNESIQTAIKGYVGLQTQIQDGTLQSVTKSTDIVTKNLELINTALDVADIFMSSQMTKDFFLKQIRIIKDVKGVTASYFSISAQLLSKQARKNIQTDLDDASIQANKSLSVASNAFVKKQLNISERLGFIKEANEYLSKAEAKIDHAIYIISTKKQAIQRLDEKVKLYKALF